LTTLRLDGNRIGAEGAKAIAEALKNLRKASASGTEFTGKWRGKNACHFAFQSRASRHPLRSSMLWSSCQNELNDDTGDALRAAAQPGFAIDL